jgi:hypothetical protein
MMAKLSEVQAGQVWEVRWHDGSFTEVEILGTKGHPIHNYGYGADGLHMRVVGTKRRLRAKNLSTGRIVEIKSAAKLRRRVR